MIKILFFLFIQILTCISLSAQKIESTINLYSENLPVEKIHIHFDKEIYLPGETVWFKAYVFEENMPSQRSTNFYISLYNDKGKALQQKIYPIINSTADGYFDVPDTVKTNELICRAYTNWMLNFDTAFLYTKTIKIYTSNSTTDVVTKNNITLEFFAEGGDIIEGETNTIAFKASYTNGLPFAVNGIIKSKSTGEVITAIKSVHDGMGRFDIQQQPDEVYYAEWTDNNNMQQKTELPAKKANGVSLKLVQQKTKLYYNVVNKIAKDTLYLLAYMYQKIIYKATLSIPYGERINGIIPLDSFPTGVLQVTVFNPHWQPVAERVCFINNNNYTLDARITTKETSIQKRGKNTIEIVDKIEKLDLKKQVMLPAFPLPQPFTDADDFLHHLSFEGAKKRYGEISSEVQERIDFELSVIKKMGFAGYFLIVSDFCEAAIKMKVAVGPGRGSAAGSVSA